jgi:excisionase family DNA binding protein
MGGDNYSSVKAIALEMGVNEQRVRDLISEGELAAIKIGKELRIPEDSYRAFLARLRDEAEQQAEVKRRQRLDPSAVWDLALCVGCGEKKVICTRESRTDGWVLCSTCTSEEGRSLSGDYEEYFTFKNNRIAWLRAAGNKRDEDNAGYEDLYGDPGTFVVYECQDCGCPHVVESRTAYKAERGEEEVPCTHPHPWSKHPWRE